MGDRMTKLETEVGELKDRNACEHGEIKNSILRIEGKLDIALEKKADKAELTVLDNRFWAILIVIITFFLGLVATALKAFFGGI